MDDRSRCVFFAIVAQLSIAVLYADASDDCRLMDEGGSEAMAAAKLTLDRLALLKGRKFSSGPETLDGRTAAATYSFGLCSNPVPSSCRANSTVVAVETDGNCTSLGLYNETEIVGGDNWITLTFSGGDDFAGDPSCGVVERQSIVNIVCDPTRKQDVLEVLHVSAKDHKDHCFYSFVLSNDVVCASKPAGGDTKSNHAGLGSGSVLCIIFFTVVGVYVAFGVLYRRIVVRAKGIEQIPNYDFWREFGNLQADGCDFLCRCGGRQEAKMYQGIGGTLSGSGQDDDGDSEDRDDRLLPM